MRAGLLSVLFLSTSCASVAPFAESQHPTPDLRGQTSEFSAGVRKTFWTESGSIYPYIGLGLSAIRAQVRRESGGISTEDTDSTAGLYVHGGIDVPIGP